MKITDVSLFLFITGKLFLSCSTHQRQASAIRDFSDSLQPRLTAIVSGGIVDRGDATLYLEKMATGEELTQLSQSEHPVLRSVAFRAMLDRRSFNHFDLIMHHLDDTAIVATDNGEFGIIFRTVSDDILQHGKWKDSATKNQTIETVILQHNYLRAAYTILPHTELRDKYYVSIRDMAIKDSPFEETELALYALASYKKSEDIPFIQQILLSHHGSLGETSFKLIGDFPNEDYLEVFEDFYPRSFYRIICHDQYTWVAARFIESLAVYKNVRSAWILNAMLTKEPFMPCNADTNYLKPELVHAIWNNPCRAYAAMRNHIEIYEKKYLKKEISLPSLDNYYFPPDTSSEPIRGW